MAKMKADSPGREMEAEICRRSLRLALPASYWKGRPAEPALCPVNILLFHRQEPAVLMEHSHHQHHRFILIANLEGWGKVGVDARLVSLQKHQSLLIFPFQSHCYLELAPDIHWLFISFEYPRESGLDRLRNHGGIGWTEESRMHLRNVLRAWQSRSLQETLPLHLGLCLHEMVRMVVRLPKPAPVHRPAGTRNEDLVERVNRFVFQNRHRAISIDHLAAQLGFSVGALRKRFQEATGRSIGRHAREVRLNHACELLYDTRLRIEEVADRCGYESLFAFSRAFHKAHGLYPSQYRKTRSR